MPEVLVERDLYEPVSLFLSMSFAQALRRRSGATAPGIVTEVLADTPGLANGAWTRPDLATLAISRGEFIPFLRADLHTFEVKTGAGLDVRSVHEANAHSRFAHFAWLVFQALGRADRRTETFDLVLSSANRLGVGVITFVNPNDPTSWFIDAWPQRSATDDATADAFVRECFTPQSKDIIRTINSYRPGAAI